MLHQWLNPAVCTWSCLWSSKTLARLCLNQWGTALCDLAARMIIPRFRMNWYEWCCLISDSSDTKRRRRTSSILWTSRGTMLRSQLSTWTGEAETGWIIRCRIWYELTAGDCVWACWDNELQRDWGWLYSDETLEQTDFRGIQRLIDYRRYAKTL